MTARYTWDPEMERRRRATIKRYIKEGYSDAYGLEHPDKLMSEHEQEHWKKK